MQVTTVRPVRGCNSLDKNDDYGLDGKQGAKTKLPRENGGDTLKRPVKTNDPVTARDLRLEAEQVCQAIERAIRLERQGGVTGAN
jgi:hypothetical protein